MRTEA